MKFQSFIEWYRSEYPYHDITGQRYKDMLMSWDAAIDNLNCEESQNSQQQKLDAMDKIIEIAASVFRVSITSLGPKTTSEQCLGWDSMGHINFILELEKAFGISFDASEISQVVKLEDAYHLVGSKGQKQVS